jgi:hypothetical protein
VRADVNFSPVVMLANVFVSNFKLIVNIEVFFAELLNMQVFLPLNSFISKYSYSNAEYCHIRVFLPYRRIRAYRNILTLSQNNCIFIYSYIITEYLHIQAYLPHSRILANTSIFTILQNTCIYEYSYRMAEYLHIRLLLLCSRIIVYASILRNYTALTGKYLPAFRRGVQTS